VALRALLTVDATGVAVIVVVALVCAGEGRASEAQLVGASAVVGLVTWLCALVAVRMSRSPQTARAAEMWVWLGATLNSIGGCGVAVAAALGGDSVRGMFDGSAPGLLTALVLVVAGALLSIGYVLLLRPRAD
jgi:hypothetical protein